MCPRGIIMYRPPDRVPERRGESCGAFMLRVTLIIGKRVFGRCAVPVRALSEAGERSHIKQSSFVRAFIVVDGKDPAPVHTPHYGRSQVLLRLIFRNQKVRSGTGA